MVQPPDGFAWPRAAVTYFDGARTSSTQKPDGPGTTSISRAPAPPVRPSVRASTGTPIRLRHRHPGDHIVPLLRRQGRLRPSARPLTHAAWIGTFPPAPPLRTR